MSEKIRLCVKCQKWFPIEHFHKHKMSVGGRCRSCKWCRMLRWHLLYDGVARKYKPKRQGPAQRARRKLRHAIECGLIKKPNKCSRCGRVFKPNEIHGHHHDGYKRALDVLWLCASCHSDKHQGIGQREYFEVFPLAAQPVEEGKL